jgi:hypothetical protein
MMMMMMDWMIHLSHCLNCSSQSSMCRVVHGIGSAGFACMHCCNRLAVQCKHTHAATTRPARASSMLINVVTIYAKHYENTGVLQNINLTKCSYLGTNLITALSGLKMHNFPHF